MAIVIFPIGYKEELGSSQLKKLNEEDLDSKIQDISE